MCELSATKRLTELARVGWGLQQIGRVVQGFLARAHLTGCSPTRTHPRHTRWRVARTMAALHTLRECLP
jgi:hypothetical protein